MSAEPPLAFLSHASEVKETFVKPLAGELARHGVRSWLDAWEIPPGDSLPRRIFPEGMDRSDAIVLIVSPGSVDKPWVREELDAAVFLRVEKKRRMVTVCLDGTEPPLALAFRHWIGADNTAEGAARAARRVADLIHGVEPPIPVVPRPSVPGLSPADGALLTGLLRTAVRLDRLGPLPWPPLTHHPEPPESPEPDPLDMPQLLASVPVLEALDAVTVDRRRGRVHRISLTPTGYLAALPAVVPDHRDAHHRIVRALVEAPPRGTARAVEELAETAGTERLVVRRQLAELADRRLVELLESPGGRTRIVTVSPALRRMLGA
ncbi:toll/interleukin-1 receptor domain-containing protein [Streptomyces sp. NPDC048290]|uniref:toll/interleukin-1 receptor domain-containing protein n=1 Tax=Streptomyces sp. NPDC048290 TaxID=3155811 RepID=UPI00342E2F55